MPVFPSQEWMDDFCAKIEADPRSPAMAKALEGVYRFVVEPHGALHDRHAYEISIVADGDGTRVAPQPVSADPPRLTITASYLRWVQMLRGELDIPVAVMLRRIKVSGDLSGVMGNMSDARPLLDALSAVDSTFLQ
ncbi:MAG: hypothetical protein GEU81_05540 [Nitriliruptorales bacterium]|nr:hypothetical protein [Nitriliruptorales bacterium]